MSHTQNRGRRSQQVTNSSMFLAPLRFTERVSGRGGGCHAIFRRSSPRVPKCRSGLCA